MTIHQIEFGNTVISYTLEFSNRRKTLAIQVSETGVKVIAPANVETAEIEAVMCKKAPWILQQLADFEEIQSYDEKIRFLSGEKLPYLGRNYRLKINKEAADELKKLQFELANGELISSLLKVPVVKSKTFVEIYTDWLVQYETTVQASTLGKTVGIFKNHILPALGKYLIDQITVEMCQQFINKYPKKLKKFKDVINYTSLIFEFALKRDYIQKNPMKLIDRPKPAKKINGEVETELFEENFYTVSELNEFIEAAKSSTSTMIYTFLHTLAYSGIR
ncbi:YgjP-like metallopeptidase domain-containing protein [Candidatus Kurthia intestinigallinarum]|uniref:YgjP-like metallopeptidase domain-containing protein n=1 Tax=Candidatus Kurthia intestinigallinarum TaxID=1562256 RepID=UPI000F8CE7D2|nr:YgjP-like metallopeptidase domain-containing protein [Kurthia sp. 3B1D]